MSTDTMYHDRTLTPELGLDLWSAALDLQRLPASMAMHSGRDRLPMRIELQQWMRSLERAQALVQLLMDQHGDDDASDQ